MMEADRVRELEAVSAKLLQACSRWGSGSFPQSTLLPAPFCIREDMPPSVPYKDDGSGWDDDFATSS
ncbi:unnamed protein product [Effrenium voratum]|uniref:Uncharacterized protein n=1 Tax=Effrenium voratum TaxID=2562239 RepID=A0AA36NJE2_9DINO|nr:unnamed protein product [Effrenium voratum]